MFYTTWPYSYAPKNTQMRSDTWQKDSQNMVPSDPCFCLEKTSWVPENWKTGKVRGLVAGLKWKESAGSCVQKSHGKLRPRTRKKAGMMNQDTGKAGKAGQASTQREEKNVAPNQGTHFMAKEEQEWVHDYGWIRYHTFLNQPLRKVLEWPMKVEMTTRGNTLQRWGAPSLDAVYALN